MNWLILMAALEFGWAPIGEVMLYKPTADVVTQEAFYSQIEARALAWDHVFVGGQMTAYEWFDGQFGFFPFRMGFMVNGGFEFRPLEVGFRWYCTHPVTPMLPLQMPNVTFEGAEIQVYVRVATDNWR